MGIHISRQRKQRIAYVCDILFTKTEKLQNTVKAEYVNLDILSKCKKFDNEYKCDNFIACIT